MAAKKKKAAKKAKAAKKSAPTKKAAKKKAAKKAAAKKQAAGAAEAAADGELEEEPRPQPKPMLKMPSRRKDGAISLAYGTEADQAFMVYALAAEKVDTGDRRYELIRKEIQMLDNSARRGTYDVSPISLGVYPQVDNRYFLLTCGASFGDHRGPKLVARTPIKSHEVDGLPVAVPSLRSTAAMALCLWLRQHRLELEAVPTAAISLMVRANKIRAGMLVNEDQVTFRDHNLVQVVDLGQWWGEKTEGLPLALGANVIRRDINPEERALIALDLKRSIAYALGHREEALDWAMQFAGKRTREALDEYVSHYVNDLSLDCGERGRQAVRLLFDEAVKAGILDDEVHPFYHGDEDLEE